MSKGYRNDLHRLMSQPDSFFMMRYTLVRINVEIRCDGRGLSSKDIDKLKAKLVKTAKGRSKLRHVSAV